MRALGWGTGISGGLSAFLALLTLAACRPAGQAASGDNLSPVTFVHHRSGLAPAGAAQTPAPDCRALPPALGAALGVPRPSCPGLTPTTATAETARTVPEPVISTSHPGDPGEGVRAARESRRRGGPPRLDPAPRRADASPARLHCPRRCSRAERRERRRPTPGWLARAEPPARPPRPAGRPRPRPPGPPCPGPQTNAAGPSAPQREGKPQPARVRPRTTPPAPATPAPPHPPPPRPGGLPPPLGD